MSAARREQRLWAVRRSKEVRFRRFVPEALAFNPITWETHLLTGNAVSIFARLMIAPATTDELIDAIAASSEAGGPPETLRERVSHVLDELRGLELIGEVPELTRADP